VKIQVEQILKERFQRTSILGVMRQTHFGAAREGKILDLHGG
jgi:hypothetical protein